MKLSEFRQTLDDLKATNSRNEKKDIIREVSDSPAAISFLSGSEFDDIGLGKKTVKTVAENCFAHFEDDEPTLSESIAWYDSDHSGTDKKLSELRDDLNELDSVSGNQQERDLGILMAEAAYPSVVSFAVLNDEGTGVSDTTIANALDLKDALPFYDSVVEAVEVPSPIEEPMVHNAFDPMLAKSESSLPDNLDGYVAQPKLDGYRLLVHVARGEAKAFTRRRNDVTESLPELDEIDWPDGEFILDCEVIAETGNYSDTSERIGRKAENVERDVEMEFGLFDVLTYNGRRIFELPYRERYGWTVTLADLTPDERVGALPIFTDTQKAKEVSSEYEGLIWKDLEASYEFGKRSTAWVKEKHMAETVDLVAAEFIEGEGRLDGTMGKIRLETADGAAVGATGSGFSDEQRDEVWANQDEYLGETLEVEGEAFDSGIRFPIFQRWRTDDGEPDSLDRVAEILPEP